MKFQGLDPRTQLVRWGLFAIAVGIVIGATAPSAAQGLATAWESSRASLPWLVERLAGFLAYFALAGSVVYGLLLSTKILDVIAHRPITFNLHQDLASVGLGLAGVHGVLLGLDKTIPFSLTQIAVPGLAPYAPLGVAAGQIAFYLTAMVIASFYVRRTIGQRTWRVLHYLTFFAFIGATAHGLAVGSDSGSAWAWWIYVGATVAVTFLFSYRVVMSVGARNARRSAPATVPSPLPRVALDRSTQVG
jgi:predicted ferric reductase